MFRRRRATHATSPTRRGSWIAIRPGRLTGRPSPIFPMSPASTNSTCARRTAWVTLRRSSSQRIRASTSRRNGRPTARKSPTSTITRPSGISTWNNRSRCASTRIFIGLGAAPAQLTPAWSPDSKWLAYARRLKNFMSAIYLYSIADNKSTQVTDGMSDARYPGVR